MNREVIMDKSRIYIIEENRELLDKITKQINKVQNYQIIGTATHAVDAITFFETNKYIAEYFSNKSSFISYFAENEQDNDDSFFSTY